MQDEDGIIPPERRLKEAPEFPHEDAAPEPPKEEPKKRRHPILHSWKFWLIVGLLLAGAIIAGILYYLYAVSHVSTNDAYLHGHIIRVAPRVPGHVARVLVHDNQWVEKGDLLVELDAHDYEARVRQAQGALDEAIASNDTSKIGAIISRIENDAQLKEAEAGVKTAEAAVQTATATEAAARSQLREAQQQVAVARAVVRQSEAAVKAAQAVEHLDQLTLKRYRDMYEGNAITRQQLDDAIAQAEKSAANVTAEQKKVKADEARVIQAEAAASARESNLRQAESKLAEACSQLEAAKARLAAAKAAPQKIEQSQKHVTVTQAQIEKARGSLQLAMLELSYTKVCAPESGYITNKTVEPGAYFQPGQAMLSVVPPTVWVVANFKETDLTHIWPGQPVEISVDAYPGKTFEGYVNTIQSGTGAVFSLLPPENATGNFIKIVQRVPVKICFSHPVDKSQYHLEQGMSVVPVVDISHKPSPEKMQEARGECPCE